MKIYKKYVSLIIYYKVRIEFIGQKIKIANVMSRKKANPVLIFY